MMHNRNRRTSVIITATNIQADTEIEFGNNKDQISIDRSSEGIWKPLFFDVDENSNIHIPDFFKGRIAIFTKEGKLHKEIKTEEGISPRMNYFALNLNDTYTTYDNYTLYLLNNNGAIIWKGKMGLGAIPKHIYRDTKGIYIKFSSKNYNYYPYIKNKINSEEKKIQTLEEKSQHQLLYKDNDKIIWIKNGRNRKLLINNSYINIQTNNIDGSGYWVVIGMDKKIYYNLFSKDSILINIVDYLN